MRAKHSFLLVAAAVVLAASGTAYPAVASGAPVSQSQRATTTGPTLMPDVPGNSAPTVTGPPEQELTEGGYTFDCWNIDGGIIYYVNAPDIHIWNYPGGSPEWDINQNAWFDSNWLIRDSPTDPWQGPYHCVSLGPAAGIYWVYGFANFGAPNSPKGFVGLQYLDIRDFTN